MGPIILRDSWSFFVCLEVCREDQEKNVDSVEKISNKRSCSHGKSIILWEGYAGQEEKAIKNTNIENAVHVLGRKELEEARTLCYKNIRK